MPSATAVSTANEPTSRSAISDTEPPVACVRIVTNGESPGRRPWIVNRAIPWTINVSGTIYNRSAINITADISGGVSDVNNVRGVVIDVNISNIVNRVAWRDGVNRLGYSYAYFPWPRWSWSFEPYGIVAAIESAAVTNYRIGSVYSIKQIGTFDRDEFWFPVIIDCQAGFASFDS
jgi:hypothetical protein